MGGKGGGENVSADPGVSEQKGDLAAAQDSADGGDGAREKIQHERQREEHSAEGRVARLEEG